jgi:hypothetical protein
VFGHFLYASRERASLYWRRENRIQKNLPCVREPLRCVQKAGGHVAGAYLGIDIGPRPPRGDRCHRFREFSGPRRGARNRRRP